VKNSLRKDGNFFSEFFENFGGEVCVLQLLHCDRDSSPFSLVASVKEKKKRLLVSVGGGGDRFSVYLHHTKSTLAELCADLKLFIWNFPLERLLDWLAGCRMCCLMKLGHVPSIVCDGFKKSDEESE